MQNLILSWVYVMNILHQTDDYACKFHFVQKRLFLTQNHQYKKGQIQKKFRPRFLEPSYFSDSKTS
jgi:hypothetical protein